jgi:D-lactate dehydrogenase
MRITFFEIPREFQRILTNELDGHEVTCHTYKLTIDNISEAQGAQILVVFIDSLITKEIIDSLQDLELIVTQSTGYDHIDFAYANQKGIVVTNVPNYGSNSVAEFTFALLLTLSRRIFDAYHQIREDGDFDKWKLQGFDLSGKTIGILGTGRIGRKVVKIANGFDMNVIAYEPSPNEEFARENEVSYLEFDEVMAQSDIITLHVPYTKETHHILNKEAFHKMKEGVVIINTARGELIDTDALIDALHRGKVSGVGLDVLESERELREEARLVNENKKIDNMKTLLQDHVLIDNPRVIITPHIAFHAREANEERIKTAVQNIIKFVQGEPINVVK